MLTGSLPFKTKNIALTTKKICCSKIKLDGFNLSISAMHFLKRILDKNPETRITPRKALSHPFILKNSNFKDSPLLKVKKRKSCYYNNNNEENENVITPTKYYE